MASSYLNQFASPVAKLVRFFKKSRDRWKAKHARLKQQCKLLMNQTRAVERSRERWRERAHLAEKRLRELQKECEALKGAPQTC
jgi:chromosome segregation ATPase